MYLLFLADLRTGLGRLLCGQSPRDRSSGQPDIVRQTDLANTATGGKKISPASLRRLATKMFLIRQWLAKFVKFYGSAESDAHV